LVVGVFAAIARGSPSQDATLSVRPFAGVPPAAVSDLNASSTTTSGQIRLTWTGPPVYPGSALDSYQIRVQTFSLASVGGNTTTWWNASGGLLIQGLYGESPGATVVRTLGPPGSSHNATLGLGVMYYAAVRSADDLGASRDFWSSVTQVDSVFLPPAVNPAPPKKPTAVWGELAIDGTFTLRWRAVTHDTNNLPVSLDHYKIERYSVLGGTPVVVGSVSPGQTLFSEIPGGTYFYRVRAVSTMFVAGAATDLIDSTPALTHYILAPDDVNSRLAIPGVSAEVLRQEYNTYGDDVQIVAIRKSENENDQTLKAYLFRAERASSGQVIPDFALSLPVPLQVSYALNTSQASQLGAGSSLRAAEAQAIAEIASLFWFNGTQFIRLGGTIILDQQAFQITTKNLGLYEIRVSRAPGEFGLSRGSPYPRVITPNGNENRRVFFFADNPTDAPLEGTIYDVRGAKVRELRVNAMSPTPTSVVWDGRDEQGAVVPSGVYLYEIRAGDDSVTGTVAVAR